MKRRFFSVAVVGAFILGANRQNFSPAMCLVSWVVVIRYSELFALWLEWVYKCVASPWSHSVPLPWTRAVDSLGTGGPAGCCTSSLLLEMAEQTQDNLV